MDPLNPQVPLDLAIVAAIICGALGVFVGICLCSRPLPGRYVERDALDAVVDDYADALRDLEERDAPRLVADRVVDLSPHYRDRLRRQEAARGGVGFGVKPTTRRPGA